MKRFLKVAISLLMAYIVYRILVEYLRPARLRLEEEFGVIPQSPEPPQPPPPRPESPELSPEKQKRLNLNQADVSELIGLPGIGPKLAERIIAHREQVGPFSHVDDLAQVQGVGSALVERLRTRVMLS